MTALALILSAGAVVLSGAALAVAVVAFRKAATPPADARRARTTEIAPDAMPPELDAAFREWKRRISLLPGRKTFRAPSETGDQRAAP